MANYSETPAEFESSASPEGSALNLHMVATACAASGCPTIYQSDRGTLVVQGYAVSAHQAGIDLPDGEQLVEIPVDLVRQMAKVDC